MRRRKFIALVGGAMAGWPTMVCANRPDRPRVVGILALFPSTDPRVGRQITRFKNRIKFPDDGADRFARPAADRVSDGGHHNRDRLRQLLQGLNRRRARRHDDVSNGRELGAGLVASLARPGGNVTGFSLQATELATKRLELLGEVRPGIRRVAFLWNPGNPSLALQFKETQEAARVRLNCQSNSRRSSSS